MSSPRGSPPPVLAGFGLSLIIGALLLLGVTSDIRSRSFGDDAERYLGAWAAAWSAGDPFDTVRFYAPDVLVVSVQADSNLSYPATFSDTTSRGSGRVWLANWLAFQSIPRERSVETAFVDEHGAGLVMSVEELDALMFVRLRIGSTGIAEQDTLRWRDAHLAGGAPDPSLEWLDEIVQTLAATVPDTAVATVETATGRRGPAIFVEPDSQPDRAVVILATNVDGCPAEIALTLELDARVIVSERRTASLATSRRCEPARASPSWSDGLTIPPPLGEQETGEITTVEGSTISIFNGTPELEELTRWGLDRFMVAGLSSPTVRSVTFAPVPACVGSAGVIMENLADDPDLVVCTDTVEACGPVVGSCTSFAVEARFGLLHELAHVWLLDHVEDETIARYLAANELTAWRDGTLPWHQRGAERAADTIAWALMDQAVLLTRLGDPPCSTSAAGFTLLTDLSPQVACGG